MSKIAERVPALATSHEQLAMTTSVLDTVVKDGRVEKVDLVGAVNERLASYSLNQPVVEEESRKALANHLVNSWANRVVVKLDRTQRVPVYQVDLGFRGSYFKVGSTFVQADAVTAEDLAVMLERFDHRADNAATDASIFRDFVERATPGLQAGQNLVEQFEAGALELFGRSDKEAVGASSDDGAKA